MTEVGISSYIQFYIVLIMNLAVFPSHYRLDTILVFSPTGRAELSSYLL